MPRDTLTREQIIQTAVEVLDAEGVEGLNMRRLGTRLGSAATAVYWHVKSKDELLVLAADEMWGEIELPDPAAVGWRQAAAVMARNLHAMVLRHPWLVTAMSTHTIYGPGKARHDDHLIGVYEAAGFTGRQVDWALNAVFVFALGQALGEASDAALRRRLRRTGGDEEERMRATAEWVAKVAAQFPRLRARLETPDGDGPDESFEFGLQTVLDGLEARLAGQ
ncbi:TetR/AcrR family transcriptional regulator [Nonomuraea turkmeniaca]|uniref:TetR/AcrR family transcriptional regulator n=1 Tax=Nonomuraea turkmeniaca TaxID=103838 RepID=A0A5S4F9L2_9ACTN|nr:TetR/AcrR family transcriptional regulator [Nonomuraea turkmeniaca]TMR13717.1 TetR/AcrR family transcriptional regulator [Nonomuraea turkmeniaca]